MLNFLNTAVLAVAAAAILPFLLHLFSKRKVKIIPFSSIVFLKAMQKRQVRAIKIKQILLLIVRTLIILLVVLAFARPAVRGGYLGAHASVSAVIVVDNSASMGLSVKDGRLIDLALKRARDILAQMGQGDEVAVLATTGDYAAPENDNLFGNPAAAASALDRIGLTDTRADLTKSFNAAAALVAHRPNVNREIYLIGDFQENAFSPDQAIDQFAGKLMLVELPTNDIDNAGIVGVDFGNQLIEVGTEFTVAATVKKRSGQGGEEIVVSLYLDDKRVAQQGMRLKAGESGTLPFAAAVNEAGFHSGYVALSDDDLLADNTFFFTFYIPSQFTVLVAGGDDLDSRLFSLALAPDETVRRHWSLQPALYSRLSSINLSQYDVIILSSCAALPEGDVARIKEYVKKGGGLLVNPGRAADTALFNRDFGELTGVRLTSTFPTEIARSGYYLIQGFDLNHPILSVFKGVEKAEQTSFKAFARYQTTPAGNPHLQVLARWSDGSPAMTVATLGRGRAMFFGCDLSPDISDVSLHPFFVPLIVRSVEYLSDDFSTHSETIIAGSAPVRTLRHAYNIRSAYTLVMPGDRRRIVNGENQNDIITVACGRLDQSGFYAIFNESRESDRFAVNVSPDEGDLYRADWGDLTDRFAGGEKLPYSAAVAGFITEKRFGRELWHYFLAAAVILLLAEMVIARDRGGLPPGDE